MLQCAQSSKLTYHKGLQGVLYERNDFFAVVIRPSGCHWVQAGAFAGEEPPDVGAAVGGLPFFSLDTTFQQAGTRDQGVFPEMQPLRQDISLEGYGV